MIVEYEQDTYNGNININYDHIDEESLNIEHLWCWELYKWLSHFCDRETVWQRWTRQLVCQ